MDATPTSPDSRPRIAKISIVTPCRNARQAIAPTIQSVLTQTAVESGRIALEYLICDGASDDGTVEVARGLCGARATITSEPDRGMYDALGKGLRRAKGDVIAYLNAGDVYSRTAFDVVADVFEAHPTKWLTGLHVTLNARHQLVACALPYRYRRGAVMRGIHGRWLPFIQQESTFWRRELHEVIEWDLLSSLRLAGDCYLWSRFAAREELWIVESYLGGFTVHGNHLSENQRGYWEEASRFLRPARLLDRMRASLDRQLWRGPTRLKKALNPQRLLRFNHQLGRWG